MKKKKALCHDSASQKKKMSSKVLKEKLEEEERYECCVATELAEEKGKPAVLIGYRIYKKEEDSTNFNVIDTAISGAINKEKKAHEAVIQLLKDTYELGAQTRTQRVSIKIDYLALPTLQNSIYKLAIHVKSNTSLWYGGFFGNRKENELKEIAEEVKGKPGISEEEAKAYLLKIAYAAMQHRGSSRMKDGKVLPTSSGLTFIHALFDEDGKFTGLKKYLYLPETKQSVVIEGRIGDVTGESTEEKSMEEKKQWKEEKRKEEFYTTLHGKIVQAAGLELKITKGCLDTQLEKVEPSVVNAAGRYKKP